MTVTNLRKSHNDCQIDVIRGEISEREKSLKLATGKPSNLLRREKSLRNK